MSTALFVLGIDEAELVVGRQGYSKGGGPENFSKINPNPAGWLRIWTLFGLGSPPKPQYVWDMILGVSQRRLLDGGVKQGQGAVRFELTQVPVGLNADELAAAMGGSGTFAILAGNQAAPNLQARVEGVKRRLAEHPDLRLLDDGVFFHEEVAEIAAETVARAQSTHPEIEGWAFVGGWPLFTAGALKWAPGAVEVVSVDALLPQLRYLESGHVGVLLEQDCFAWGYRSVDLLLDRILFDAVPEDARVVDPLTPVRLEDVPAVKAKWAEWLGDG